MRIACLQFNPQLGNIAHNLKRAEAIISRAEPMDLDLLVLPEMAFSGYNFKSLQEIGFHLEPTAAGPSTVWARSIARRLRCFVSVGYPEYTSGPPSNPQAMQRYSSAVLVSPQGNVVTNYRKSFLFSTDETWATEGQGFFAGDVPGIGNMAMGICMDLNPYKFLAPFEKYEFANHVLQSGAELVVLSMAWLTAAPPGSLMEHAQVPDADTLAYWVQRLQPLIDHGNIHGREITVVINNRVGTEGECNYAGTSVVLGITQGNVKVYGCLGRATEDLLVCDVPGPLNAKPYRRNTITSR
ncbi:carbon-nitrogen hydrolase [Peziza echinospora]|nr:carbon-nitrogen hydrolase [Peziza echinospora]